MSMPLPNRPTDELVAVAWIASIPGMSPGIVATQLPPDADKAGRPAAWVTTPPYGFVTVSVAGGAPDPLLPVHRPVLQVDCWSVKPGSNKPPWHRANRLAEAIQLAAWDRVTIPRPLAITANGVTYPQAAVNGATVTTAPRRIYDDAGDYARYSMDLLLQWVTLADVLT